jgi:hypothetical protein
MPPLHLGYALSLLVAMAEHDPERYARAASRWAQRFQAESADVSLEEGQLVAAALAALPTLPNLARPVLREIARSRRMLTVKAVFDGQGSTSV